MRLLPASSAAAQKRGNVRVTPGRVSDVLWKRTSSVPKKRASAVAAAPLKVLWPELYEGNGGVVSSGVQSRSGVVAALTSGSASRIPYTGRQKLYRYLQS